MVSVGVTRFAAASGSVHCNQSEVGPGVEGLFGGPPAVLWCPEVIGVADSDTDPRLRWRICGIGPVTGST